MSTNNNVNVFDLGRKIRTQIVVCVILSDDGPKFLTKDGDFSSNIDNINCGPKETLFDIACEHPDWNDVQGRCVFLTGDEAKELFG